MSKYPTIKQTLEIIREFGMRASYVPEYKEFQVSRHDRKESTYFTDSRHDAIFTAREMSRAEVTY